MVERVVPDVNGWVAEPGLEILDELGRGAQAVVYRVRRQGRLYALKVLRTQPSAAGALAVNLRREAAMLTRVAHHGLARIHAVGQSPDGPFLVMDLVQGTTLSTVLQRGPLDEIPAATVVIDVAGALSEAHRSGLIHRDVKPQNVMVLPDGHAKIIDFGLAARVDDAGEGVAGTFAYVAPEQTGMLNRLVDARSDLYALGVMLYQCLTGRLPFTSLDLGELLRMHATMPAPDVRLLRPELSATFAAIVAKLLAKDPDDRYLTGEDLVTDLRRVCGGDSDVGARPRLPGAVTLPPEHELIGRASEVAELLTGWQRARAGSGEVCLVRGPVGVGKSRLVAQLCADAAADGAIVLHAAGRAADAMPLAPLRRAVDRYLGVLDRLAEPARTKGIDLVRDAARPIAALLRPFSLSLAVLAGASGATVEESPDQLSLAVATFLTELARRSPAGLLLHVDDVEHLDGDSRRMLRHLATDLPRTPLLVAATTRADPTGADPFGGVDAGLLGVAWQLESGTLNDAAMARLVEGQLVGAAVPASLIKQITTRSGGNPLMATEYLRAVIDAGLLRPCWGTWILDETGLDALDLPADALGLVVARIDGLDPATRGLLVAAAAIGLRFDPAPLARVCEMDLPRVLEMLAVASERRLIGPAEQGRQVFLHDRIREALLADILPADLRRLHQRIAAVLDAVASDEPEHVYAVAQHYSLGETDRDPAAVFRACLAAGRLALAHQAPDQALEFLLAGGRAATAAGLTRDSDFLGALGTAYLRTGRITEALPCLRQAIATEPDPLRRAAHYLLLAEAGRSRWDLPAMITATSSGLAEIDRRLPTNRTVLLLSTLASMVAGLFIERLGRGFAKTTDEERERYRMECALLSWAAVGATTAPDLLFAACLGFRQIYPSTRLGPSPEYVHSRIHLATAFSMAKRQRSAERIHARLRRLVNDLGDPRPRIAIRWAELTLQCGVHAPTRANTEALRRLTDEEGRWFLLDEHISGLGLVCGNLALFGYATEGGVGLAYAKMGQADHRPGDPGPPDCVDHGYVDGDDRSRQRGPATTPAGARLHRRWQGQLAAVGAVRADRAGDRGRAGRAGRAVRAGGC